ncbi:hypothetical protein M9Y10_043417 [Tritrichomonas musculus]|uniref:BTB domain-containing protein n=1 Tax=Tritrichomonas musculus TaxID=1915356 RepID=A0ABR2JZL2_9EUKA
MLNEDEISLYFSQLPRDLKLHVNETDYFVNKDSVSVLSGKIRSKLQENSSANQLNFDYSDPKNIFPLVINFLQGQQIIINPQNVFYLQNAAEEFEIPSLQNTLKEELQRETCKDNIIQKIIHCNEKPDMLFDYIQDSINNDDIFDLPREILVELIHSPKSRFTSDSSRYSFALTCCKKFPDHINEFLTSEDISKIPIDVISQIVSDPEYQKIKEKLPNSELSLRILEIKASSKTQINEVSLFIENQNDEMSYLQAENDRISLEIEKLKNMIVQNSNELVEMKVKIEDIKLGEIADMMQSIESAKANEETLNSYGTVLDQMDMIDSKISYYINKMQATIFVYHESRTQAKKLLDKMKASLEKIHGKCAKLKKNDNEIDGMIEKLTKITQGIQKIIVDNFINSS